jgi:FtsZ-interacting cell division protein ZipA
MNSTTLVIVIVVAVIILVGIGFVASVQARRKRSQRLRERFGPEYDRTVERADDRRQAEADLRGREKRHQKLDLRPLDPEQRRDFQERWSRVQHEFVDDPGQAINDADRLVIDVMGARGYPTDNFDQRAGDLSVEHPTVTQRYREARRISRAHEHGGARTEDMRQAVTSYRSLVDALLDEKTAGNGGGRQAENRSS